MNYVTQYGWVFCVLITILFLIKFIFNITEGEYDSKSLYGNISLIGLSLISYWSRTDK